MTLGGEATAIGTDTLAEGAITSRVADKGNVTIASGTAAFSAAAQSSSGTAYAAATSFADVSNADLVLTSTRLVTTEAVVNGVTVTTETSVTKILAIDIERFDFKNGPLTVDISASGAGTATPKAAIASPTPTATPLLPAGNIATLEIDAIAQADNTLVEATSSVLALENQLSTVAASVTTAIA